jgi:hypothetical protein
MRNLGLNPVASTTTCAPWRSTAPVSILRAIIPRAFPSIITKSSISRRGKSCTLCVMPRGHAPVSQQHVLHIRKRQRPLQQRIVVKINLVDRQIIGGAPIGIHLVEHVRGKSFSLHGSTFFTCAEGLVFHFDRSRSAAEFALSVSSEYLPCTPRPPRRPALRAVDTRVKASRRRC